MTTRTLLCVSLFSICMSLWIAATCDFSKFLIWPWAIVAALAIVGICRKVEEL